MLESAHQSFKMVVLNPSSRSISLPPRPHPLCPKFDEHLSRLRFSKSLSTSTLIADRLADLIDLYDCVDGLLMLPHNQTSLHRNCQDSCIEGVLDGSIRLLDICSTARDALIQIKEQVQGIQSVLRRRCSGELSFIDEVNEYVGSIKGVKKVIRKCLEDFPKDCKVVVCEGVEMVHVLREVERVTSEVFQSLLCYMVGVEMKSRRGSWALVSRILVTMACEAEAAAPRNEFDDVDGVIGLCLEQRKRSNGMNVLRAKSLMSKMVKLETVIQDFDELLESLFRRLVKTRATLLNIISM